MKIDHWQFDDYDLIIDRVDKHLRFNIFSDSFDIDDRWLMMKLDRYAKLVSNGIRDELIQPQVNEIRWRIEDILKEHKELIENDNR